MYSRSPRVLPGTTTSQRPLPPGGNVTVWGEPASRSCGNTTLTSRLLVSAKPRSLMTVSLIVLVPLVTYRCT